MERSLQLQREHQRHPISARLTPPAERNLANFQNMFGFVRRF